jgi:predicted ATPase
MLTSRIDRLPADQKELRTLAVVGREFALDLVKQLVQKPEDKLDRLLFHLQVGEFIYEQPAFPESKYTFKHALTQEAAYNSLLIGRRKELHRHAAAAIEALYRERLDDHLSELARHYSQSGDTWKAVEYLHLAAQRAAGRLLYEETVNHLAKALELLNNLPDGVEHDRQELSLQKGPGPVSRCSEGTRRN